MGLWGRLSGSLRSTRTTLAGRNVFLLLGLIKNLHVPISGLNKKITTAREALMAVIGKIAESLQAAAATFTVEALAKDLQPEVQAALIKHGKAAQRQSKLSPLLTVWFVLALPLRRELGYHNLLSWLLSGLRALAWDIPKKPLADGAVTHARKRIGVGVIRDLFEASKNIGGGLKPDFHGFLSLAIDGTGLTMPDTPKNLERFGKPGTNRGVPAFPQMRLVALVAVATQAVFDVAFAPYRGKGTGEIALGTELVVRNAAPVILFLLDRGFCAIGLLHTILARGAAFLIRVPNRVLLRRIRGSTLADGSYRAWLVGKVEDPSGPRPDGRKRWLEVRHEVRVVEYQIRGFRKTRLITSLLDPEIPARELVRHYHRRWEIELAYDAIKTHQCATRTGQSRTIFRSKLPVLVEQELYAMLTLYNLLRDLINQAAQKNGLDPLRISFVDTLQTVIETIPAMQRAPPERLRSLYEQLLDDIARCVMKRWRRKRAYPRVVKVKMSSYRLKRSEHKQTFRDFDAETKVCGEVRLPA
jgi:hypothetical protein